jgi:glycosyltransferase involved in cell wall biosynthesis
VVLFLHNRYRTTGGEERTVEALLRLVREELNEPAELLTRDSASLGRGRAAVGLLRGGLASEDVARAVRLGGARIVHAHNLNPAFGWRALAAARKAGAKVVLHLHQYRLVCAIGVCYTRGQECTRCHGPNTLPGVRLNCRNNAAEALTYGAALALWQRRLVDQADAVIVPSAFARERLRELGAPLPWDRVHVVPPPVRAPDLESEQASPPPVRAPDLESEQASPPPSAWPRSESGRAVVGGSGAGSAEADPTSGSYALVVSRLAPEKGVDVAIEACRLAGLPLVIAGDGPDLGALRELAGGGEVRFVGHVDDAELARLRANAAIALVPSRSAETFGMAAAEALACGLPVAASRVGALPELVEEAALAPAGDPAGLAAAIGRVLVDRDAGPRGRARVRALCAPQAVADCLARVYGSAGAA